MSERHGLPDTYPFNEEGFREEQAAHARWVVYEGISPNSEWHLVDGAKLELWPGGAIFNEHGTLCGWFKLVDFGPVSEEKP